MSRRKNPEIITNVNALLAEAARLGANGKLGNITAGLDAPPVPRKPITPSEIYALYRTLDGEARFEFYCKNASAVWAGYCTQQNPTQ